MAPNSEHFAKVVRRARRARDWTQAELAHRSGVSLGTVIAIEHARSSYWGTLAVLAQALEIKFSELVKEAEALADDPVADAAPTPPKSCRSAAGDPMMSRCCWRRSWAIWLRS